MLLLERFISLYAPFTCVGCSKETDALLCSGCLSALPRVPSRCYHCRATTREYAVCGNCQRGTSLRHVYAYTYYDAAAKELLHHAKYERARAGLAEIAEAMHLLIKQVPEDCVFVPVPTATSRVRQRGYDQAEVLASQLAQLTNIRCGRHLLRIGQAHQVGANRKERIKHLEGAFRAVRLKELQDAHIVLVDDVLTTGATLEAAARTLKKAGARQVDALVFCQAG